MSRVGEMIGGKFTLTALAGVQSWAQCTQPRQVGQKVALKLLHADLDAGITRALLTNAKARRRFGMRDWREF